MTQPTTAQLSAVASAVAVGLRDAEFMPRGAVSQGYFAKRSLEDAGLVVAVMPRKTQSVRLSRGGLLQTDLDVTVGVFSPLVGTDTEIDQQVDSLLLLSQQIEDLFVTESLSGRTERLVSASTDATGDTAFDPAALLEKREFSAFITLTFRGTRQAP